MKTSKFTLPRLRSKFNKIIEGSCVRCKIRYRGATFCWKVSDIKTHFVIEKYMVSLAELLLVVNHHLDLKQQNIQTITSLQLSLCTELGGRILQEGGMTEGW
jgi:hypothetical protein